MNISRFFGITNREAMRQVRLALGPDALILSNRRVNGGVEILATDATSMPLDEDGQWVGELPSAPAADHRLPEPDIDTPFSAPTPDAWSPANEPEPVAPADERVELMSAIGELRGALENRIDELMWSSQLSRTPQAVSVFQTLLGCGFSTALLRAMLKRLPQNVSQRAALDWARRELVKNLPVLGAEDALWIPGRVLALVGPTGVGKTTTVAKLAARCVRRHGPQGLVLVTTDTYRIGAHEQLRIYGDMLGVPVHVVNNAHDLVQVMATILPEQTVIIDNIGMSQRDRYIADQAAMLAASTRPVGRLLVLNASSQGDTLDEVARTYSNDGGTGLLGCIITKMDEASRPGAALDTAIRYRLPIHYVSVGQKVPEDLVFPQADDLIDQALTHRAGAGGLYAPSEADFAALLAASQATSLEKTSQENAQRQQWLPMLLSVTGAGAGLDMTQLRLACDTLEEHLAPREALGLWRHAMAQSGTEAGHARPAVDIDATLRHLARVVQQTHNDKDTGLPVIAVHDQVALPANPQGGGRLRASLLFSGQGHPWASTLQLSQLSGGWLPSHGAAFHTPLPAIELLRHQVFQLGQQLGQTPVVHVFDGGSPAAWQVLESDGVDWLALIPPTTRVYTDDCATLAGAVASSLPYQPLTDFTAWPALVNIANRPAASVVVWAADQRVQVQARGVPATTLRLVSVRIVDRETGDLVRSVLGLANVDESRLSTDTLAAWLVMRHEAKMVMRHAATAWRQLAGPQAPALQRQLALTAAQLGLAAWQVQQDPKLGLVRRVAMALVGKRTLPASLAAPVLIKLFAARDMVAGEAG